MSTAWLMESHGVPGSIHVTHTTYVAIKDCDAFDCISRGVMDLGDGRPMKTYLVKRVG